MKRAGKKTLAHNKACADYRDAFFKENGFVYCESCDVNEMSFPPHSVHHIVYASRAVKNVNHTSNLIILCNGCHVEFHSGKRKEEYEQLVEERGLRDLFNLT